MEAAQEHADRTFPPELSQWFTTPFQQSSIVYTSHSASIPMLQHQPERAHQTPILDKPIGGSCETTDVAFVGYILESQSNGNEHQILEIQNVSPVQNTAMFKPQPRLPGGELNPSDYLSVVMLEPKIKDATTNTDENWDSKKMMNEKKSLKPVSARLKPPEQPNLEQRFHCQYRAKNFSNLVDLLNHDRCSHNEKLHECLNCEKKLDLSTNLDKCLQKTNSPYLCQVCNVFFSNPDIFIKHEQSHRVYTVRKHKCDPCGLEFSDVNVYKKHLKIHSEAPYSCIICDKTFSTNSACITHKRIHTGERPYKCDSCDKRFFTKSHVQTHRRVHSGERPFVCSVCGRAFADGSSYRRHEKLHQQNKKYQCQVCNRGFPLSMSLSKHMAKHHSYSE